MMCRLAQLHRDGSPSLASDVEQMSIRLPTGPAGSRGEPTIFIATCEQPDRGVKRRARPAPPDTGPMPIPRSIRSWFTTEVGSPRSIAGRPQHFIGRSAASRSEPFLRSSTGGRSSTFGKRCELPARPVASRGEASIVISTCQ